MDPDTIFASLSEFSVARQAAACMRNPSRGPIPNFKLESEAAPSLHACCPTHDKPLLGHCKQCNTPVCDECQHCVEQHTVTPLADVVDGVFPEPPSAAEIRELATAAREALSGAHSEVAKAMRTKREAEGVARVHNEFVADVEHLRACDVGELARMRGELAEARARVGTNSAKDALAAAYRRLEVDVQVDEELTFHRKALEKARITSVRARAAAARLQGVLARLEFVSALEAFPRDAEGRAALALAAHELGFAEFGWAATVRSFSAFRDVAAMAEVAAALAAPLRAVGPVEVSEPTPVEGLPGVNQEDSPVVSLSACGVLCVGGYVYSEMLTVAHLPTRRAVQIKCGEKYVHGFVHDGELFVAQRGRTALRHAPVAEVLAGRTDLAEFEQMRLAVEWGPYPRLDTAACGWVAAANHDNRKQHLVVDLAARTSRLVDVGRRLPELGGFTGIAVPGAGWVAGMGKPSATNTVFAVAPDGKMREIASEMNPRPTVLPSSSRPDNLTYAAVFDANAQFSVDSVKEQLQNPVRPHFQSLVRLYRDVFLCWDDDRKAWLVARIVVP